MIIASVTGPGKLRALAQARATARYASLLEYRMDCVGARSLEAVLESSPRPAIITVRPVREGGKFSGRERDRLALLERAAEMGAACIDMEFDVEGKTWRRLLETYPGTTFIASRHILRPVRFSVRSVYRSLAVTGAPVLKFAFVAPDASGLRYVKEFLELAAADGKKGVCLAMGEGGEASRVLYRFFGGWATYGSAEGAAPAAAGQIPARELKTVYRAASLSRRTRVFGVIGTPLAQSKGMYMHNAVFGRRNSVYCRFPVSDLRSFLRHTAPFLRGFSVTLPHKETIIPHLDAVDPVARAIGAVNTVVRRGRRLVGTNTDAAGALDAIETVITVKGKTMLLVGAGGAARALAFEAARRGARVLVTGRNGGGVRRLAAEVGGVAVEPAMITGAQFDILANTTPVGMTPDVNGIPVPPSVLRGKVVFDAVYNPPLTRLLREARAQGSRIVAGTSMYVNQAAEQSRLFTGRRPSKARLRGVLARHLGPLPQ